MQRKGRPRAAPKRKVAGGVSIGSSSLFGVSQGPPSSFFFAGPAVKRDPGSTVAGAVAVLIFQQAGGLAR